MDRSKSPVLAVTILVVVVGCVLAWPSGGMTSANLWEFQRQVLLAESSLHLSVAVILLVGGMCYAHARRKGILWLTVAFAVLSGVVGLLVRFRPATAADSETWARDAELLLGFLTRTSTAVPVIVLLNVRLRGRLDRWRAACLSLMGGLFASECVVIFSTRIPWLYRTGSVLETVLLLAVMAALTVVSWAVAYRQIPVRQMVAETGKKMGITCPRCGLAQEVTLPDGECAGCRLRILVSLEGDEVKG